MRLEIVDVESRSFATDYEGYWRSVPVGTYTVKAWARCGSTSGQKTFPTTGEYALEYQCVYNNALLTLAEPAKEIVTTEGFPLVIR